LPKSSKVSPNILGAKAHFSKTQ